MVLREGRGGGNDLPEGRWIRNGPSLSRTFLALMLNKPAGRIEFCSVGRIVKCKGNFQIYSDRLFGYSYSQSSEAIKTDMEKGGEGERENTLESLALVWSKRSSETESCSLGRLA